jgi:lipoic acid synthetase
MGRTPVEAEPADAGGSGTIQPRGPKPPWLRIRLDTGEPYQEVRRMMQGLRLHTVCQEARCPNIYECWGERTATFMILGDVCTRACGFCAVATGRPRAVDPEEPERVAEAVARLGLEHVVITSVDRDDLPDGGAGHFAEVIRAVRRRNPRCEAEVLTPDFRGVARPLDLILPSGPVVFSHNTETVPRLYPRARRGSSFERSVGLLREAARWRGDAARPLIKTGLMLGLGETDEELQAAFALLAEAGVEILTLGQYLRPTLDHLPVERYVTPDAFAALRQDALGLGFRHVEAGPLVRSSYHARRHARAAQDAPPDAGRAPEAGGAAADPVLDRPSRCT